VLQGLDRAGGLVERGGDLGGGEAGSHAQQQHLALVGWELLEGDEDAAVFSCGWTTASRWVASGWPASCGRPAWSAATAAGAVG
jgi:hypothetical protein